MKRYIYSLLVMLLAGMVSANAQTKTISGLVRDKDASIGSASVLEKGVADNGTTTDNEGRFSLTLRGKSNVIIISAIGYVTREIDVSKEATVNIVLESDASTTGLEEVVVLGYGKQSKITLTGAVSSVSGRELRQNPTASVQNSLLGRLPGFFSQQPSGRPGADGAAFFIRGVSSYTNNNQPLIIVDDIEFSYDQFARIDPNEIETLSILKDASTTAVYGIKGANGVVVVTTRRGKIGPPTITFRGEGSMMQPSKIPKFLNAYQSALLYNQAQINDNEINPSPTFKTYFTEEDLELYKNGTDPFGHPDVNWREVLFKDWSKQLRGNLDIQGGTERVKYFISVGYLFQDGMLRNYSKGQDVNGNYYHKRYNYRSNLDISVTKTLDLRLDLYGNIGEINNPSMGSPFGYNDIFYEYSSFLSLAPFAYPVYNPDGSYGYSKWQRDVNSNYNTNNVVGRLTYNGYDRNFENNMNLVAGATQKLDFITKGLSAKANISYASAYTYTRSMTRNSVFPTFIYDSKTETYEPRDPNTFRVRRFFIGYNAGSTIRNLNLQAMINYDRTFSDDHHAYGLVLVNQFTNTRFVNNATYNFVPQNFRGYTARLGYDYKSKYLFQFNAGYNGSDRFTSDKRYGFFPAVSVGWNLSEENFFKNNIHFIDRMKIRSSYGLVGSDNIGGFSYTYIQTYVQQNGAGGFPLSFGYSHNGFTGIAEGTLANEDVTWEKEKKFDLGLELGLWNNRISATIDYFNNNRYDILTTRGTVSAIFGQGLPPVNLGKVNNKGFELELTYNGTAGKNISWFLKGTYSVAKNKIVFMDEPLPLNGYQAYTGKSIGQIRVYEWIGYYADKADIDASPKPSTPARPGDLKYADKNNDGLINEFDMSVTGYPNLPNTVYGLQLGFSFKNFSINALFQGAKNFNVRGVAEAIRAFASNLTDVHLQAWTPDLGQNALYPRLSHNGGVSDPLSYPSTFWFISGNYLRLKSAEISYALPEKLVKKMRLQNVRFFSNGYNLLTWSDVDKRYQFDPEINSGTDRIRYPPQRTINFGVSVTF